jgi:hypothetical protein
MNLNINPNIIYKKTETINDRSKQLTNHTWLDQSMFTPLSCKNNDSCKNKWQIKK